MASRSHGNANAEVKATMTENTIAEKEILVEPSGNPIPHSSPAEAARAKAVEFASSRQYDDARKALDEAEACDVAAEKSKKSEAARIEAAKLISEHKYAEAKKLLTEAEALEAEPMTNRPLLFVQGLRAKLKRPKTASEDKASSTEDTASTAGVSAVDKSVATVNLYSKIAAAVGLLPGGLLNFAAILAVQIVMVWKIANDFGHKQGKDQIRGSILSLIGSLIPTGIGHGLGAAIVAAPAVIAGTAVYFIATPVLAYAMTRAVGNVFIMHFESGGTLLTFDPRAFGEYFLEEFHKAGGRLKADLQKPASETAAA